MVATDSVIFACDNCRKRFRARGAAAGRWTACPGCGSPIQVPPAQSPSTDNSPTPPAEPETVGFGCRLCGTRLYAPVADVGKSERCPDCHTLTTIPAPRTPPKPRQTATQDIDPYELYQGEEQPRGIDLARAAPAAVSFECRVCQTHLSVTADAVGKPISCPDCGAETHAPRPVQPAAAAPTLGEGYELDAGATAPSERADSLYAQYTKTTPAGYRALAAGEHSTQGRTGTRRAAKTRYLVTESLHWLRSSAIRAILLAHSVSLTAASGCFVAAVGALSGIGNPFVALYGVCILAVAVVLSALAIGATAAYALALLEASWEGATRVEVWPTNNPTEWFGPGAQAIIAVAVSAAAGGAVAAAARLDPDPTMLAVVLGVWLVMPWTILSQLDFASPLGVFSPRLLRTLWYAPLSWLLFYVESGLLATLGLAAVLRLGPLGAPVIAFALLQTAWLLGRLAWSAGDATPDLSLAED